MDVAKEFIDFFKQKEHEVYSSMSLVPNDTSLLFTNAGMVQFKDIFTGSVPAPSNKKAVSRQLCVRAGGKHNDLENVGYTTRHHTLFEMLGNFSFGEYFKESAISYAWEFITVVLKLDVDKLWVTVHHTDDEAFLIWTKHIDKSRIKKFGDKDNFWQMGNTGPCGPCSEIFYDQGESFNSSEDYLGGDGDRFLEIWNLVFMQYQKDKNGNLNPLPHPSIDTGMGLERVEAIIEGVDNNFKIKKFVTIIDKIKSLGNSEGSINSYRVIADHIRSVSFMLNDGVLFDKEGRGYVLRRILRRAVRHGYLLGFREPFLYKVVDTVASTCLWYEFKVEYIKEQVKLEEERFFKTIVGAMDLFNDELSKTENLFSGSAAFRLYDTYGFPLDLTEDMLRDKNIKLDIDKFNELMNEQKTRAKSSWKGSGDSDNLQGDLKSILDTGKNATFIGYQYKNANSKIDVLLDENLNKIDVLNESEVGFVMLDTTPFYPNGGGQIGDIGRISNDSFIAFILSTDKYFGLNLSKIEIKKGSVKIGDFVKSVVANREEVEKHHSATHLLQAVLKDMLGDNVSQAGSLNDSGRLRFDFTYPKALTKEQLEDIENGVNKLIVQAIPSKIEELPIDVARNMGAIAMFGEKYGDIVRVVQFKSESIELCGGLHVDNTANIGSFYITKESGVSAGVRRIEAVCGVSAICYANSIIQENKKAKEILKSTDLLKSIDKLKVENRDLKKSIQKQERVDTSEDIETIVIGSTHLIVSVINGMDLKTAVDELKNRYDSVAIMLFGVNGDRVNIVSGSKGCVIKSGEWIKAIAPILGGNGGGRDDFAQAGGKDSSKIDEATKEALAFGKERL
jgi:alanyl-tRNA synthetase